MQSLPGGVRGQCARDKWVALPAIRGGMHAACTSVGLRMDIAAKAETICLETPRSVKDCICCSKGLGDHFGAAVSVVSCSILWVFALLLKVKVLFVRREDLAAVVKSLRRIRKWVAPVRWVFDRCTLSTESTSLSDPMSLSHSSNRIRLVGLGDCDSISNRRLSPIIMVRAFGSWIEGSECSRRWVVRS
jgi:hypothetical protein